MTNSLFKEVSFKTPDEWKKWRQNFIGASDMSVVRGKSPYKKRQDLLYDKINKNESEINQFIAQKGHKYEELMRKKAELLLNTDLNPAWLESLVHPFLSCSLDGWSNDKKTLWECKLVGQKVFDEVRKTNRPPTKYEDQCQQQLLISGAEKLVFWCGVDNEDYIYIDVFPDKKFQEEMIKDAKTFYNEWLENTPPPESIYPLIKEHFKINSNISLLKKELEKIKKELEKIDFKRNVKINNLIYKRNESKRSGWNKDKLESFLGDKIKDYKKESVSVSYSIKEETS